MVTSLSEAPRRGRPPLPKSRRKAARTTVRLAPIDEANLRRVMRAVGATDESEAIRTALAAYVERIKEQS